jgi:hypothetical protein
VALPLRTFCCWICHKKNSRWKSWGGCRSLRLASPLVLLLVDDPRWYHSFVSIERNKIFGNAGQPAPPNSQTFLKQVLIRFKPVRNGYCRAFVCWLAIALFSASTDVVVMGQDVAFPGLTSEAKSPDGRYTIQNTDDEKREPAHTLSLVDNRDGVANRIYSYSRHVVVLWSPTSAAFVVNDYEGSDASHPLLFTAPWTNHPVDLKEKLVEFLHSGRGANSILANHHVYLLGRRWLSGDEVLCRVTGYGDTDPKGFSAQYVYTLRKGFRFFR